MIKLEDVLNINIMKMICQLSKNLIIIDLDKKWQYLITIGHLLNQNLIKYNLIIFDHTIYYYNIFVI